MQMPKILLTTLLVLMLVTAGCTAVQAPAAGPMPTAGEITVANVMARPSPMAGGNGAAYMTVLNGTDADVQLTTAASPAADVVELHETMNEDGIMRMVPQPDGFTVPAGGGVELKPGGKHVMLIGLVEPLEVGQEIEITLSFDNGDSMALTVPVMEMGQMNMDGHDMEGHDMEGEEMEGEEMETESP